MNDANGATLSNNLNVNGVLTFHQRHHSNNSRRYCDHLVYRKRQQDEADMLTVTLKSILPQGQTCFGFLKSETPRPSRPIRLRSHRSPREDNLTSSVTAGDHPSIASSGVDPNHSVNRYWTIVNNGIAFTTYTATFDFVAGDIDAGSTTGTFIVGKLDAAWSLPTVGTKTGTSTQATGMNSIYASGSSFVVGNVATTATNSYRSVATGNWSAIGTWQRYNGASWVAAAAAPDSTAQNITLQSPYTVTITATANADQLEVQAGATLVLNATLRSLCTTERAPIAA